MVSTYEQVLAWMADFHAEGGVGRPRIDFTIIMSGPGIALATTREDGDPCHDIKWAAKVLEDADGDL